MNTTIIKTLLGLCLSLFGWAEVRSDWPQASGPSYNYVVKGKAATSFSGTTDTNIRWRAKLPNTGQGTPVVYGNRVFIQCHEPISKDTEMGSQTIGLCFDAKTGRELWRRELPASRTTDLSSLFSDNTAASAIVTSDIVAFVNVGGRISVYDHDGEEKWTYEWVPFGRHHSRQHEPFVFNNQIFIVKTIKDGLPISATTKSGSHPLGRGKEYWTHLHAFDLTTGKTVWVADTGTGCHAASTFGYTKSSNPIIMTGRGGGHQPPEEPFGISRINALDGSTDWEREIKGYPSAQNVTFNSNGVYGFVGQEHVTLDPENGNEIKRVSLTSNVNMTTGYPNYETKARQQFKPGKKAITYQTNIVVGDYHFFLSHQSGFIG
ncbi:MAG: PQQ-binding-like beta-propeller repeat protein, partial [Planctomycetota bacterium]|nr:PQQ-binding-like beta-propeller repeat protein [Planctomycetota bacterium]